MNAMTTGPARSAIAFPAALTDELFQRWLDLHPGRRENHERREPKYRAQDRARVARMYALRGCDIARAMAAAVDTADKLYDQLETILRFYGPNEAERVLKAAGVPLPHPHDSDQAYDGEAFAEAHAECVKAKKRLEKFIDRLNQLQYVFPDGDKDDPCAKPPTLTIAPEGE